MTAVYKTLLVINCVCPQDNTGWFSLVLETIWL